MRLDQRLRALEAWVPELGNRRAEDMTDRELERILAESLGWTPERVHNMSDAELATVVEGGTP